MQKTHFIVCLCLFKYVQYNIHSINVQTEIIYNIITNVLSSYDLHYIHMYSCSCIVCPMSRIIILNNVPSQQQKESILVKFAIFRSSLITQITNYACYCTSMSILVYVYVWCNLIDDVICSCEH